MASADLAVDLSALSLSTPSCVRFRPTGDRAWLQERLDDIPRYLFRVFTPESGGETNRSWTKSRDARFDGEMSIVDILARQDDYQVANMLNRHLRWWPCSEDNFVSWTSSLLFALQYTFFLHISDRDRSTFDDIKICIIDTTNFAEGVFLRDMDLIQAYRSLGPGLKNLWDLRSRKHDDLARSFYFGEYLSQGALKIEGKCEIVSTQEIIDHGLFHLQPEFEKAAMWEPIPNTRPPWANEVIRLREVFYQRTTERQSIDQEELQAAIRIASLFEPRWRLPVAANFIALLPRRDGDSAIQQAFREPHFTGSLSYP
ncbi:hypothetical protein B0J12DRAFT_391648 [Macrophomina phaseolina]|uniref:DUF7587 domain-containing protein n=1 Tax=Macrophomina phaseolina TaxID=35725 RepID=A0ABQ8FSK3_9PEZI|nr:hypothetical protein B0J12DRAFT_391648 [Macrophomina phaseolina]